MSNQPLDKKAERMMDFLIWLEDQKGADISTCLKKLMKSYRLDRKTAIKYLEELKFVEDIKIGKDHKIHSTEQAPL